MDRNQILYVTTSFGLQVALIVFFAARKWAFAAMMQHGWIVYALGVVAIAVSVVLYLRGAEWYFWIAGVLYLAWAVFGYTVDIGLKLTWRDPVNWAVLIPYIGLYLAMQMFYWWPLMRIQKSLWVVYTVLFIINTGLNFASH